MEEIVIKKLELNKVLASVASFAALEQTKRQIASLQPCDTLAEAEALQRLTAEADAALFRYGAGHIEAFPPFHDELERAQKGASLSCGELLSAAALLRSARVAYRSIQSLPEECSACLREIAAGIYFDEVLENDISAKILGEDEVSDTASDALYDIRRSIRSLNERIRTVLGEYLSGEGGKYLQDAIVTMRDNRYVIPVRAEHKAKIRGFVHDRSASGATFFIEPEQVLDMNNELRELAAAEKEEIERILAQLSGRVGAMVPSLRADIERLCEIDAAYAKAEYSYKNKCLQPKLNDGGMIRIVKGRHPLLDPKTAIPVSLVFGGKDRFLLISGPNTGGKTVTLKMCGLFCMMACCGLFLPAAEGTEVSVFASIFCDIGDAQSIEENLSTFSSHISNIIGILARADAKSLALIDELGGGTDPDEGQALAKAILSELLRRGCRGIVTTHYTSLKEFAYATDGIENASMEFDMNTLQPLYRIDLGVPGSSNAIAISRRLGLPESVLEEAVANLSESGQKFENILRTAEQSRIRADEAKTQADRLKAEWGAKLAEVNAEREKLKREREKLFATAKMESRRIVRERTERAEELLSQIEEVAKKAELTEADLIRARTLKNKLADQAYDSEREEEEKPTEQPVSVRALHGGDRVFVKALGAVGEVLSVHEKKKEAEVLVGSMRLNVKEKDLCAVSGSPRSRPAERVRIVHKTEPILAVKTEINLLGMTVPEAIREVDAFIDRAVLAGLEEVKIIHGIGTGKLKEGIRRHLREMPNVQEFRAGAYGEGEAGVTIVKLR